MCDPAQGPLANAIATNNRPKLRTLLESQDLQLFSELAQYGTPEIAQYLLSRQPILEDHSQLITNPHPTVNPYQYLVRESARCGNDALFRYLIAQEPKLLSTHNRNIQSLLWNAVLGGIGIWTIILEKDPTWKDYELPGHQGTILEMAIELGAKGVLAFLLREGADVAVLEATSPRKLGADNETLELIAKYQKT